MIVTKQQAISLLKNDQIVALPTETVYGLAANIYSDNAIKAIFNTKKRPINHPLIVHIADMSLADGLTLSLSSTEKALMETFWPGPMTLVTKKSPRVSSLVTGGQDTVAIRYSAHPLFNEILRGANVAVAAPSANPFKSTSPTTSEHVETLFNQRIPVVDGGCCEIGIESTILRVNSQSEVEILRPGYIDSERLFKSGFVVCRNHTKKLAVSGNMKVHYQPKKKLHMVRANTLSKIIPTLKKSCAFLLLTRTFTKNIFSPHICLAMPSNPKEYGAILYNTWHQLDKSPASEIYIELPPEEAQWQYILDKITKASQ